MTLDIHNYHRIVLRSVASIIADGMVDDLRAARIQKIDMAAIEARVDESGRSKEIMLAIHETGGFMFDAREELLDLVTRRIVETAT